MGSCDGQEIGIEPCAGLDAVQLRGLDERRDAGACGTRQNENIAYHLLPYRLLQPIDFCRRRLLFNLSPFALVMMH